MARLQLLRKLWELKGHVEVVVRTAHGARSVVPCSKPSSDHREARGAGTMGHMHQDAEEVIQSCNKACHGIFHRSYQCVSFLFDSAPGVLGDFLLLCWSSKRLLESTDLGLLFAVCEPGGK